LKPLFGFTMSRSVESRISSVSPSFASAVASGEWYKKFEKASLVVQIERWM